MQRAAIGTAFNIAAGASRWSTAQCLRYLSLTRGSLVELERHPQIAHHARLLHPIRQLPACCIARSPS